MTPTNQPKTPASGSGDELQKDISDIIEFPQLPKGSISTRDLRGQRFSSSELGYKLSLIMERITATHISRAEIVEKLPKKAAVRADYSESVQDYAMGYNKAIDDVMAKLEITK